VDLSPPGSQARRPVLIVHGSDAEVVPVSHAYRLARRAGDAEVVILEGAAHHLRRHPQVVPLVVDWLPRVVG
jgi:pimeloyl-ACP methyl ester carboxylesterase